MLLLAGNLQRLKLPCPSSSEGSMVRGDLWPNSRRMRLRCTVSLRHNSQWIWMGFLSLHWLYMNRCTIATLPKVHAAPKSTHKDKQTNKQKNVSVTDAGCFPYHDHQLEVIVHPTSLVIIPRNKYHTVLKSINYFPLL